MRCLIICHGYFGDHIFASSIAEKLIEEKQFDTVDYVVGFPQIVPFFQRNPYINHVIVGLNAPTPSPIIEEGFKKLYDKIFQLTPIHRIVPPTIEFQESCGVKNTSTSYMVYTNPMWDKVYKEQLNYVRQTHGPILAIMNNWQPKAFLFTKEQYERGVDVPYKGYGGQLRDIPKIISAVSSQYPSILCGAPESVNQFNTKYTGRSLDQEASLLKHCDFFIGAEGGLANIAAGVGCNTIITSDFIAQLYGPNGCIEKNKNPQLGPHLYFPDQNHSFLNPYLSDDEIIDIIQSIIKHGTPTIYNWLTDLGGR